jgi:hypothetical protein
MIFSNRAARFAALRQKYAKDILLVLLLITFLLKWPSNYSYFWSNLGWLQQEERGLTTLSMLTESNTYYFDKAIQVDRNNQRAYFGAGVAFAALLDENQALNVWRQGNIAPDDLLQAGSHRRDRGLPDVAFIYFRNAEQLEASTPGKGHFLAGKLCQHLLVNLASVSATNQQYCHNYFTQNNDNLLLNGQFEHDVSWGWTGDFFFRDPSQANINLDHTRGMPAPSLVFDSWTSGNHAGLYQRIAIQPGATIQFSGYFRTRNANDLATRLLYIEWRQENEIKGTHFHVASSDMEWRYLERVFTLPVDSEPWVQFYPIVLIGRGTVWVDDVCVEILSD